VSVRVQRRSTRKAPRRGGSRPFPATGRGQPEVWWEAGARRHVVDGGARGRGELLAYINRKRRRAAVKGLFTDPRADQI
jgi:hypothetical protein